MNFANVGQTVWVPSNDRWIPAVVICSCGDMVRVENQLLGISRWYKTDMLQVSKPN